MKNVLKPKGATEMPYVKVLRNGQITLPKEYREVLGIAKGQILEVVMDKSKVVLKPKVLVDATSTFTTTGKKKIKEALEDVKKGKVSKAYDNVDEMIKDLDS